MGLILIIIILMLLLLFIIWIFVKQKMDAKEKYSNIDVLLQRRYDLIPNYVKAVEKYLGHENKTLKEVTEARNWQREQEKKVI
jgi:LemA protein